MANLPYLSNPTQLTPGYFGRSGFENFKTIGYPMYYNGDVTVGRFFNAVWNDYAEAIHTNLEYYPGEVVVENGIVEGVCTDLYGRSMGNGNTHVSLMGRVPLRLPNHLNVKLGDVLMHCLETNEIVITHNRKHIGNILGKVIKIYDTNLVEILVF